MTLEEYLESLQQLLADNPEMAQAEVWFASDDEGNCYRQVGFLPSIKYTPDTFESSYSETMIDPSDVDSEIYEEQAICLSDFDTKEDYNIACKEIMDDYKKVVLLN